MATNNRLAHEKIIKLLFSLAIPSIIAQLVNILYNIVDRIYIGQMANGTIAMAALSVTLPIVTFVSAFTQLVGWVEHHFVLFVWGNKEKIKLKKL